ncbi:MAG: 50S ribosomal protein L17 [bacterium]
MRHQNANRKFGREKDQRTALLRSLAGNLITHDKIVTTDAKARELRSFIEKLVTKARDNSVATRRILTEYLVVPKYVSRLVKEIAPKYLERKGGYTRIVKMGMRGGDGSKMAIIEFV